ncbi:hypothetical protein HK102_008358, partial [Quaeritorhiza haematococci]
MELGPCQVLPGGNGTKPNPHSWNSNANILFLDQPVGTGFSYSEHGGPSDTPEAAEDVYTFFQLFFTRFPEYANLDFHIFGESYAGHYIPQIAHSIHTHNTLASSGHEKQVVPIKLKSVGIGNGATDPLVQYKYYSVMACDDK